MANSSIAQSINRQTVAAALQQARVEAACLTTSDTRSQRAEARFVVTDAASIR